jgi:hypothetical protein
MNNDSKLVTQVEHKAPMKDGTPTILLLRKLVCMHYMCDTEKCARLASLALLVLVAHESHDPCMRNI